MDQDLSIPVIAIDGGAGTGKGTVRSLISKKIGFHGLDSGALYRLVALDSIRKGVNHEDGLVEITNSLNIRMDGETIYLDEEDVTLHIRTPEVDKASSIVARVPKVREGVGNLILNMRKHPGLVADGRDMGKVFHTPHRFFLHTDPEEKARRRVNQHAERGNVVDYETVLADIIARDERNKNNPASHLTPHPEAILIDTTKINANEVVEIILKHYHSKSG